MPTMLTGTQGAKCDEGKDRDKQIILKTDEKRHVRNSNGKTTNHSPYTIVCWMNVTTML